VRVPHQLLREKATIRDFGGNGARGVLYGEPRVVRCQVQPTMKAFTDASGVELTIEALAVIRPEDGPVRPESRLVVRDVQYRVVSAYPMPDDRRPSHWELALARFAAGSTSGGPATGGSGS